MKEKISIDTLKEQISFLEARITRYEELAHGSVLKRILFGGGRQAKVCLVAMIVALIVCLYAAFKHTTGFLIVLLAGIFAIFYLLLQLNVIRKKNDIEKYQKMIASLVKEKQSMDEELKRLQQVQTDPNKEKSS